MAQAGKTGTTTKNRDALFAGYTPYYTCVVWGGFDDNAPQSSGQTSYPRRIWKAVMSRIHENLEYADFTKPDGIVTAQVCKESGKLAIAGVCDSDERGSCVYTEYFAEGTQPTEYCDHHIRANMCTLSGQLAGGYCPSDALTSKVFVIGGTVGTEDTPYLLTEDIQNNTCTLHNEGNSTYQGTTPYTPVPGVNTTPQTGADTTTENGGTTTDNGGTTTDNGGTTTDNGGTTTDNGDTATDSNGTTTTPSTDGSDEVWDIGDAPIQ